MVEYQPHCTNRYLKNVYPELTDVLGASQYNGEISNSKTGGCIDTLGNHNNAGVMGLCVVLLLLQQRALAVHPECDGGGGGAGAGAGTGGGGGVLA
jgi:hypothetical protein